MRWLLSLILLCAGTVRAQFITPPGGVTHEELGSMAYEDKDHYLDLREAVDPVFWIPNHPAAPWTDFELKGSTNNFASMHYFYHSPDPAKAHVTAQLWDVRPLVLFTDSQAPDRRVWIPQTGTDAIHDLLADTANSYVGGWLVYVRGLGLTRAELEGWVWSYVLMDGADTEDDPAGRSIWRLARPVDYVPAGTEPNL